MAPAATIASPDGKRARTRAPTPRRCDFSPKTYSFDDAACPIDAETGRAEASCREEDMELEHFDEGVKHDYTLEHHALLDKYTEPRVGQRVRLCAVLTHRMRQRGVIDKSLGPGSCDRMPPASTRWFGNTSFVKGNFPDIPAGVLAHHGGVGTVKYVHADGDRVMVQWDRTGKMDWYATGFLSKFDLAIVDMDQGLGTTGCGEGLSSKRLMTSRIDMSPAEAATRVEQRRQHALKMRQDLPDTAKEGDKHVGLEYDRFAGTGYL